MFERKKKQEKQPEKKLEKKPEQKQQQKQEQKQEQRGVMTNEESASLINDPVFRGRVKVACLRYADNVLSNPSGRTFRTLQWANQTLQQPDQAAGNVVGATVIDGAVQNAGKNVTDEDLQRAVEVQVNKML